MFFNKEYVLRNLYKCKSLIKVDNKRNLMGFDFKLPLN